jgi:hypothetical protein
MHLSGILVVTDPSEIEQCARELESLSSAEEQETGLRRIQALPRVRMAALVEHRIEPDELAAEN